MSKRIITPLMFVLAALLFTGCSSAALPETPDRHTNLNGTWTSSEDGVTFTAEVNADRIKIQMKLRDTEGLYWAGSFTSLTNKPGDILSNADVEVLKSSMFGSLDKKKVFHYEDDGITFTFGMAGTTREVRMTKGNV